MNTQVLAVLDASDTVVARFEYAGGRMPVARMQGGVTFPFAARVGSRVPAFRSSPTIDARQTGHHSSGKDRVSR